MQLLISGARSCWPAISTCQAHKPIQIAWNFNLACACQYGSISDSLRKVMHLAYLWIAEACFADRCIPCDRHVHDIKHILSCLLLSKDFIASVENQYSQAYEEEL